VPIRAASDGRALPLLALTALVLLPLGQVVLVVGLAGAALAVVVVVAGWRGGRWSAVRAATRGLLLAVFGLVGLPLALWPAVGVLWLASRRWPELRPEPGWFPPGSSSARSWLLAAVTVLGAAAALTAWILSEPELGASTLQLVDLARRASPGAIVAFVAVFVVVNPVVEEVDYRNVAYEAARTGAPVAAAVVLQAVAFGTLHVVGFPAGAVGVGLSFVYGAMLGIIRVVTGGLRVAVIAHVATNAAIAALVAIFLLPA
jgi:membrane protease YdiL (CAAX protease family)